jgi:hypothetical protein
VIKHRLQQNADNFKTFFANGIRAELGQFRYTKKSIFMKISNRFTNVFAKCTWKSYFDKNRFFLNTFHCNYRTIKENSMSFLYRILHNWETLHLNVLYSIWTSKRAENLNKVISKISLRLKLHSVYQLWKLASSTPLSWNGCS